MDHSNFPEPKKSWGQNYLQNKGVIEKIIDSLNLESGDVVVEIGAGRGALTREIAKFKDVEIVAIEPHPESFQYLNEYFADNNQVKLFQKDASKLNFAEFGDNYKVIGNLPYNMSTKILLQLLRTGNRAQFWILMFQLEVGERIASKPGSKKYGSISIMAQLIADITLLFRVNPGSFYPVPKVKSIVLEFVPHLERKLAFPHEYEIILKKIFSQRRKKLKTILKNIFSKKILDRIKEKSELDLNLRPEKVAPFQMKKIIEIIRKYNNFNYNSKK